MARCARHVVAGLACLVSAAAFAPAASAQQVMVSRSIEAGPGMFGGMELGISTKSLAKFAKILELDEAQQEAATALHASYRAELDTARTAMRDKITSLEQESRESQDFGAMMRQISDLSRGFGEKEDALEKQFFDDLKAILTEPQAARWPKVEMANRRKKNGGMTFLSGEGVDLLAVVEGLKVPTPYAQPLSEELDLYEVDLDRAYTKRKEALDDASKDAEKARKEREKDKNPADRGVMGMLEFAGGEMQEGMAKAREASKGVLEVNQRHARLIEPLLPEDKRAAFADAVQRQSFPMVYRKSRAEKALEAALKFGDLTPQQRSQLETLRDAHSRDSAPLNDAWAKAVREDDDKGSGMMLPGGGMIRMMIGGPGEDDSASAKARKARRELDDKTLARLNDSLTDDQKGRLPKQEERSRMVVGHAGEGGEDGVFETQVIVVEGGEDVIAVPAVEGVQIQPAVPATPAPATPTGESPKP